MVKTIFVRFNAEASEWQKGILDSPQWLSIANNKRERAQTFKEVIVFMGDDGYEYKGSFQDFDGKLFIFQWVVG